MMTGSGVKHTAANYCEIGPLICLFRPLTSLTSPSFISFLRGGDPLIWLVSPTNFSLPVLSSSLSQKIYDLLPLVVFSLLIKGMA